MSHLFMDKSPEQYKQEFVQAYNEDNKYYLLGRNLKYYQYEALRSFPIFNKGRDMAALLRIRRRSVLRLLIYWPIAP